MSILQAIILGVVQGITEFFPVSSSGHLILLPRLFGWPKHSLAFDAVLHLGTGLAVLVHFRRDWSEMLRSFATDVLNTKYQIRNAKHEGRESRLRFSLGSRRLVLIVLASVPAGLAGLLLNNFVEVHLRSPQVIAVALAAVAVLMLLVEKWRSHAICKSLALTDTLVIGFSQVLALIPGVSRSGITITAGLFCGLTLESAARFSFLLATPIVLAAGLWGVVSSPFNTGYLIFTTGLLTSFLSGLLAIWLFMGLVGTWGLLPFAIYRIILSLLVFVLF